MARNHEEHNVRLLIVDDEPLMAQLLARGLQRFGSNFTIDTATSGKFALNLVGQSHYDLALLDYRMPGMNGLTLARQIRDVSPTTQLVLMTAYGPQAIAEARKQVNLDAYFTKPVSLHTLRDLVNRLLTQNAYNPALPT